jgi:hypothetical protein
MLNLLGKIIVGTLGVLFIIIMIVMWLGFFGIIPGGDILEENPPFFPLR